MSQPKAFAINSTNSSVNKELFSNIVSLNGAIVDGKTAEKTNDFPI